MYFLRSVLVLGVKQPRKIGVTKISRLSYLREGRFRKEVELVAHYVISTFLIIYNLR